MNFLKTIKRVQFDIKNLTRKYIIFVYKDLCSFHTKRHRTLSWRLKANTKQKKNKFLFYSAKDNNNSLEQKKIKVQNWNSCE